MSDPGNDAHDCCHAPAEAAKPAPPAAHDCCHAPAPPAQAAHEGCHPGAGAAPAAVAGAGAAYVCPMCPGVGSAVPAACPKCGMALEPALPRASAGEDPELRDMRRRFWIAVALTVPLVAVAMADMAGLASGALAGRSAAFLQLALATPVVLWCGWPLLERGARSLVTRSLNMFTLIGLGVAVAYGFSVVSTVAARLRA